MSIADDPQPWDEEIEALKKLNEEIDARVDYKSYHECSKEDVDKMPPHYHRYKIRLIDDPNDADSIIHWWSLFDGSSDHHILCCPYCGVVLS